MQIRLLKFYLLVAIIALAGCNKGEEVAEVAEATGEKPVVMEEVLITMEANYWFPVIWKE